MAALVATYAVSHTPVMTNFPHAAVETVREEIFEHFASIGKEIEAIAPDAIVLVSNDHLHNFFLDNVPAFCIGLAETYESPIEDWLKIPKTRLPGSAGLGAHLVTTLLENGFDPAFSMELTLDHGVMTPLDLIGVGARYPIVPVMVNAVQPPLPTMQRSMQFGAALARALESYQALEKVVMIATGGLSHDVGTPRMGELNRDFDETFLALLASGGEAAAEYAMRNVHLAGNGAEEVRNWLVAHGAAKARGFRSRHYNDVAEWYTGIALGSWRDEA